MKELLPVAVSCSVVCRKITFSPEKQKACPCFMACKYALVALTISIPAFALRTEVVEGAESLAPWRDLPLINTKQIQAQLLQHIALGSLPTALNSSDPKEDAVLTQLLEDIRVSRAKGSERGRCWEQLGGLLTSLIAACEDARPHEYQHSREGIQEYGMFTTFETIYKPKLPQKTCAESAADIFIFGQRLVEALQVPLLKVVNDIWSHSEEKISPELAKLVQSLLLGLC